jgi:hypothetical protein
VARARLGVTVSLRLRSKQADYLAGKSNKSKWIRVAIAEKMRREELTRARNTDDLQHRGHNQPASPG